MTLSSTAKTIMLYNSGWRNDALFENKNYPFAATLSYEVEVLNNLDTLYFIFDNYFSKEYKKNKESFYGILYNNYLKSNKIIESLISDYSVRDICIWVNNYFCDKLNCHKDSKLYCKWLTTENGYNRVYKDEYSHGYELKQYSFSENSLIVSDLGVDGCLIVSSEPFICKRKKFIE
jgi:hypothetical protein